MKFRDEFLINYWWGIPYKYLHTPNGEIDVNRVIEMKEAGFNHIDAMFSPEDNKKMLDVAHSLGLKLTVYDERMRKALFSESEEKREELVAAVVNDYKDYPALFGYHIFDEPAPAMCEVLGKVREQITALDEDHESYINLFPNYAFPGIAGDMPYDVYVDDFMRIVKPEILSYDNYHYIKGEAIEGVSVDESDNMAIRAAYRKIDRPGFIDNLEVIRRKGIEYDTPYMAIVLVVEHGSYRYVTESEIRWDVFHALAYGCSRMCYFTYWTPGVDGASNDAFWKWKEGMISKEGEKTEHYYMVQNINRELYPMGQELLGKKSLGVFYTNSTPESMTNLFVGFGDVKAIEGDDITIGFFEDRCALIVNRSTEDECEATLYTDSAMDFFDALDGEWISLDKEDGKYTIGLEAGDAILVRFTEK